MTSKISSQVSEYIAVKSPLYVAFLDLYYKFLETRTGAVGITQQHTSDFDIDLTLDPYIDKFFNDYGRELPVTTVIDRRNLIKILNEVYTSKGTEKSIKLLFRALFGIDVEYSLPSEQILKASDGEWVAESFFAAEVLLGSITSDINAITFTNTFGSFAVESTRVEYVSNNIVRFYFRPTTNITVIDSQIIYVYTNSVQTYIGQIIKSPESIRIDTKGTSWQRGQVIVIPGTSKNTIARVTSIDTIGGITGIEILDYGYIHTANQSTTVSPYPNKPGSSTVTSTSTLVSIDPNVYHHTINIADYIDGVYETIIGMSDDISFNLYYLENYAAEDYSGYLAISYSSAQSFTLAQDTSITIEEWLASRATLIYIDANIVKNKGYYNNENGQISNQQIKIQDNYFYQAFSYLIESSIDLSLYKSAINITHPAGMKLFANLSKSVQYENLITTSRTLAHDTIYLIDIFQATETLEYNLTKPLISFVTPYDTLNTLVNKIFSDSVSVTSLDNASLVTTLISYYEGTYSSEMYAEGYTIHQITIG